MKKIILLCISIFVFLLVGCMGITIPTTDTTNQSTLSTEETTLEETTTLPDTTEETTQTAINTQEEISAIELILLDLEIEVPEGFSERLVEHGMTANKFQFFMDAVPSFKAAIEASNGDPTVINTALKAFLANDFNYEALFSAMILLLPEQLDKEISMYQDLIITDPTNSLFYQEQIDQLRFVKTEIMLEEDMLILVAVNAAEYLILLQEFVDNDLITNIINLQQSQTINIAEVILIKDEIIAILEENLPEAADIELVYQLILSFETAFVGENDLSTELEFLSGKYSEAAILSIQLTLEFIGSIDEETINEISNIVNSVNQEPIIVKEMVLYVADYIEAFMLAQSVLIDELQFLFTEEEIQDLFNSFISSLTIIMESAGTPEDVILIINLITENLTYELLTGATDVVAKLAGNLIEYFRESDGVLVDYIVAMNNSYGDGTEAFTLIKELLNYADTGLSDLTQEDINALLSLVIAIFPEEIISSQIGLSTEQLAALIELAATAVNNQSDNALALLNNLIDYLIINDLITEIQTNTFDVNYITLPEEFPIYWIVYISNELSLFLDETNINYVNEIMTELFITLNNPDLMLLMNLTTEQLATMELYAEADFVNFLVLINEVKLVDPENPTPENIVSIQNLFSIIQGILPQEP